MHSRCAHPSDTQENPVRLLTFARRSAPREARVGAMLGDSVVDLQTAEQAWSAATRTPAIIPDTMKGLLRLGVAGRERVQRVLDAARGDAGLVPGAVVAATDIIFLPPVMDADKFLCVGKNNRTHLDELRRNNLLKETPQE